MRKSIWLTGVIAIILVVMTACGGSANNTPAATNAPTEASAGDNNGSEPTAAPEEAGERVIEYLGESYTVPAKVERIVITGAVEAMEDALVLDVHPVGAITFGGEFPERFASIVDGAESIGEKQQPNFETILKLKPDVILGTSKFPAETSDQLKKIATYIPVSHIATNWEANLTLMGELSGKQEQAAAELAKYAQDTQEAKEQLTEKLAGQKVAAIRIRQGKMYVYPATIFVNPILYNDLGLEVPAEIAAAKAQDELSIEQFASMNPDHLFIQFADSENADTLTALEDILGNPIVKSVNAVKNDQVYVNIIDPLSEGGPAWSRTAFLKAAMEQLAK